MFFYNTQLFFENQTLTLPFTIFLTLGKLLNLSIKVPNAAPKTQFDLLNQI